MQTILESCKIMETSVTWNILTNFREIFSGIDILNLPLAKFQIIKQSNVRIVLEFTWQAQDYILKIFLSATPWDKIRSKIFPKHTQEWKNIVFLTKHGLPVPKPVGIGHGKNHHYIIMQKISPSHSLKELCQKQNINVQVRRHWARELAKLIGELHNLGYIHNDLHSGNILLYKNNTLHLIDLYAIEKVHIFKRQSFLENLAMLAGTFLQYAYSTDYLYFVQQYLQHSQFFAQDSPNTIFQEIRTIFWKYYYDSMEERYKRYIKNSRQFQIFQKPNFFAVGHRKNQEWNAIYENFDSLIASGKILKDSRSTLVVATQYGIVKQYRRKKWRNWINDWFRPSRAYRAWSHGHSCLDRGIPTPKPLYFAEQRWLWFPLRSYLVTETIQPGINLIEQLQLQQTTEQRKYTLRQAGRLVHLLHQRGFSHRDLKASNLLFDSKGQIYLIDLDGLSSIGFIPPSRAKKDYQRLFRSVQNIPGIQNDELAVLSSAYGNLIR